MGKNKLSPGKHVISISPGNNKREVVIITPTGGSTLKGKHAMHSMTRHEKLIKGIWQ